MAEQSFKELLVWQKSKAFSIAIYKAFSDNKDFSFRDQIQRAAISIPNNIAEGYTRRSDKALRNFLYIAKGSAAEIESMLLIAEELRYVKVKDQHQLSGDAREIQKLLSGFIRKL
ncbi:MAG TPA: four helix bundle protein [Candidatus Saccharimonadales bacterium]|nr:four helix bundle protein [Candidatus Saccharimonadales bacterium]